MNRNSVYIRILLVIISIAVLLVFINRAPRHVQNNAWLPSTFNPVGAGTMAFYLTLRDLNWPVERWQEPLSRLSNYGTGNVLIITRSKTGSRVDFSEQEADLLDAWVKRGNTLLLLGALGEWDDTRMLLAKFGFNLPEKSNSLSDLFQPFDRAATQSIEAHPADPNLTGTLVFPRTEPLFMISPAGARVLWQKDGQPYVVDAPDGKGHVIYGTSDQWLSNSQLGRGDNLAIILGLLAPSGQAPRHLFFEESHHGYSGVFAMARLLSEPGVRFAGMLALLGILAFLVSSLVRFGPIIPLHREAGRSTLEFIDSIADLYLRADLRNDTLKYLFIETHQRVLHRLNLPTTASHDLIASRLHQANPQLPKWKKLAQRFDSRDYTDGLPPSGWLRVACDLIQIKSAMA